MLYFGLYVQLRRGSVAGYTTDESWAYRPKEGVEAFESITFFIRFIYAINFEHLLKQVFLISFVADKRKKAMRNRKGKVVSLSVAHDLKSYICKSLLADATNVMTEGKIVNACCVD